MFLLKACLIDCMSDGAGKGAGCCCRSSHGEVPELRYAMILKRAMGCSRPAASCD
jgi:hypothetical protein